MTKVIEIVCQNNPRIDRFQQLDAILDSKNINQCDEEGNSPLHHAIMKNNEALAFYLEMKGANRFLLNKKSLSASDLAQTFKCHNFLFNNYN